mmetsp:Transcript_113895/g.179282  ORF Transcript_113895/g.179282 Transcript_113895/m.179282 type:complete len:126 (-) Transcript_113895:108-485(-)
MWKLLSSCILGSWFVATINATIVTSRLDHDSHAQKAIARRESLGAHSSKVSIEKLSRRSGQCPDKNTACKACTQDGHTCASCFAFVCSDGSAKYCYDYVSDGYHYTGHSDHQCSDCTSSTELCGS